MGLLDQLQDLRGQLSTSKIWIVFSDRCIFLWDDPEKLIDSFRLGCFSVHLLIYHQCFTIGQGKTRRNPKFQINFLSAWRNPLIHSFVSPCVTMETTKPPGALAHHQSERRQQLQGTFCGSFLGPKLGDHPPIYGNLTIFSWGKWWSEPILNCSTIFVWYWIFSVRPFF